MHVLCRFDIMYFNLKYRKQGKYFPPFRPLCQWENLSDMGHLHIVTGFLLI